MRQPPPGFAAFDPAGRREPRTDLAYSLGSYRDRDTVAALARTSALEALRVKVGSTARAMLMALGGSDDLAGSWEVAT